MRERLYVFIAIFFLPRHAKPRHTTCLCQFSPVWLTSHPYHELIRRSVHAFNDLYYMISRSDSPKCPSSFFETSKIPFIMPRIILWLVITLEHFFFFFFGVNKNGALMVVSYPGKTLGWGKLKLFYPARMRGQPSLRMPTNKNSLVEGFEPGLVRQSERTLPAEPSP